jgi:hypothetical protein
MTNQGESAMYRVRIKNTMFGYERNQIVEIVAESEAAALAQAQNIDYYADVSIVR